jgi:hypothetical protein
LVELSAAQDIEAGDGTTSVVVLAGSLLGAAEKLLAQGTWAMHDCEGADDRYPPYYHRPVFPECCYQSCRVLGRHVYTSRFE